ncbi:MAG: hypothetical protein O3A36_01995 [bacterium]|nr:hypothetical protein [bacterium]
MVQYPRFYSILFIVSAVLAGLFIYYGIQYLYVTVESPALVISAPLDINTSVPIFAQFSVTQIISIDQIIKSSYLEIPMHVQRGQDVVTIRLLRNGQLVNIWRVQPISDTSLQWLRLPIEPAQLLDGLLEITISAENIAHEDGEFAPRVFVESNDNSFPAGHYKIAQNDKKGDIAMQIIEPRLRVDVLLERYAYNYSLIGSSVLQITAIIFLLMAFPFVVYRQIVTISKHKKHI